MGFTHVASGINTGTGTSLAVTLSGGVAAGDLLVMGVHGDITPTSVTDNAGNTWTTIDLTGTVPLLLCYVLSSAARAGSITITVSTGSGHTVNEMVGDQFTMGGGTVTAHGHAGSISAGTLGLNFNTAGCGDLGTVTAGALAWGLFTAADASGTNAYTPGFQSTSTPPADVIGSQITGGSGTALSVYVTSCANQDTVLTWFGTGNGTNGNSASIWFTTTPPVVAAQPPAGGGTAMFKRSLLWADL